MLKPFLGWVTVKRSIVWEKLWEKGMFMRDLWPNRVVYSGRKDPYLYFSVCTAFCTRNCAIGVSSGNPDQSSNGKTSVGSKSAPMRFKELHTIQLKSSLGKEIIFVRQWRFMALIRIVVHAYLVIVGKIEILHFYQVYYPLFILDCLNA
jgi:hypothetical protein